MTPALASRAVGDTVCLAIEAMATRFELVLPVDPDQEPDDGIGERRLRGIGEEALDEIVRLEARLSSYRAASDVCWINMHANEREVKVEPTLFALLQRCVALSEATDGAFDITVGPLMRAWRFTTGQGDARPERPLPSPGLIADARLRVGYQNLNLDPHRSTIRFGRSGMSIDLGAAGKGYAIGAAVQSLRDQGITRALLHGGTSSIHAIGAPPDGDTWKIAWAPGSESPRTYQLRDAALSVSATAGKAFVSNGQLYGHVIDPRTGWPTCAATSALVMGPEPLECDALSTALLVLGEEWLPTLRARFPEYTGVVA
jgi:thiamine biosynthesis lipoprotein